VWFVFVVCVCGVIDVIDGTTSYHRGCGPAWLGLGTGLLVTGYRWDVESDSNTATRYSPYCPSHIILPSTGERGLKAFSKVEKVCK
jgi:hypothetical protein